MTCWIINVPVDLRDYFINNGEIKFYLAVNSQTQFIRQGEIAVLWGGKHSGMPGIIGYCLILTNPVKPTDIPEEHRKLYNSNMLQIGCNPINLSFINAIIPEKYAYLLPSFNVSKQPVRIYNKTVYWGGGLYNELQFFTSEYRHLFVHFVFDKYIHNNFMFAIHLLREKHLLSYFREYKAKLSATPLTCNVCKTDYEKKLGREAALRVLELHEQLQNGNDSYVKINPSNFVVICPTCHKIEHDKIRNG